MNHKHPKGSLWAALLGAGTHDSTPPVYHFWAIYLISECIDESEGGRLLGYFPNVGEHDDNNYIFVASFDDTANGYYLDALVDGNNDPLDLDSLVTAMCKELTEAVRTRAILLLKPTASRLRGSPVWRVWQARYLPEERADYVVDWDACRVLFPALPVDDLVRTYAEGAALLYAEIENPTLIIVNNNFVSGAQAPWVDQDVHNLKFKIFDGEPCIKITSGGAFTMLKESVPCAVNTDYSIEVMLHNNNHANAVDVIVYDGNKEGVMVSAADDVDRLTSSINSPADTGWQTVIVPFKSRSNAVTICLAGLGAEKAYFHSVNKV